MLYQLSYCPNRGPDAGFRVPKASSTRPESGLGPRRPADRAVCARTWPGVHFRARTVHGTGGGRAHEQGRCCQRTAPNRAACARSTAPAVPSVQTARWRNVRPADTIAQPVRGRGPGCTSAHRLCPERVEGGRMSRADAASALPPIAQPVRGVPPQRYQVFRLRAGGRHRPADRAARTGVRAGAEGLVSGVAREPGGRSRGRAANYVLARRARSRAPAAPAAVAATPLA